jgi:Ran GTPase-activating protein (RanGAP) involved in mRNA processing and transport
MTGLAQCQSGNFFTPAMLLNAEQIYSKVVGKSLKFNTAQDVNEICDDIDAMPDMTEIRLSGNSFGVEACKAIAVCMAKCHNLKTVKYYYLMSA